MESDLQKGETEKMKQQLEGTSALKYRRAANLVHGVSAMVLQTAKLRGKESQRFLVLNSVKSLTLTDSQRLLFDFNLV